MSRRGVPSGSRQVHPGPTCICIRALFGLVVATWWLFYIILVSLYSWYAKVHTCQRLSSSLDWLGNRVSLKRVGDGEELHSGDGTIHDGGHQPDDRLPPNWYRTITIVSATYLLKTGGDKRSESGRICIGTCRMVTISKSILIGRLGVLGQLAILFLEFNVLG